MAKLSREKLCSQHILMMICWFKKKKMLAAEEIVLTAEKSVAIRFRLSVLAWNPQKEPEDEICRKTGSGGGKEGLREDRDSICQSRAEENSRLEIAVERMTQSAEGGSEKMEVGQRRESTEVRWATAKTCWPTEAGLTNAGRSQHG